MAEIVVQFRGTVYENGYGQIAKKVMRDKSIDIKAKAIYAYIVSFAGGGNNAFPGAELMMEELGIKSDNTFYKFRKQLIDAGYLTVEEQKQDGKTGKFSPVIYNIENIIEPKKDEEKPYLKNCGTEPHAKNCGTEPYLKNCGTNNNSSLSSLIKTDLKDQEIVVVERVQNLFHESTGEKITERKVKSLLKKYPAEKIVGAIEIIAGLPEWRNGPEACLVDCLKVGWNQSQTKRNPKHETKKSATDAKPGDKYSAFFALFPDGN